MLIVDGAYLFQSTRGPSGFKVDPLQLRKLVEDCIGKDGIREAHWFDGFDENDTPEKLDGVRRFHGFLQAAYPSGPQFRLSLYPLKLMQSLCQQCNAVHIRHVQKGVDVGIATLIVKTAALGLAEHIHLVAGDGDFKDAVSYAQESRRMDVTVYGFQGTVSLDLQSWATRVIWLNDHISRLARL